MQSSTSRYFNLYPFSAFNSSQATAWVQLPAVMSIVNPSIGVISLIIHFIRGYVDGDGSIYITNNNIDELIDMFTIEMNQTEKINYEIKGFYIDALNVMSDVSNLIRIEKNYKIY